jgi:hypothetical protein
VDSNYVIEQLVRDVRALQERINTLDKRLSAAEQKVYSAPVKLRDTALPGNILYKDAK